MDAKGIRNDEQSHCEPFETQCSSNGEVDLELECFLSLRGKNAPQSTAQFSQAAPYGFLMRPSRGPSSPRRGDLGALWTLEQSPWGSPHWAGPPWKGKNLNWGG